MEPCFSDTLEKHLRTTSVFISKIIIPLRHKIKKDGSNDKRECSILTKRD